MMRAHLKPRVKMAHDQARNEIGPCIVHESYPTGWALVRSGASPLSRPSATGPVKPPKLFTTPPPPSPESSANPIAAMMGALGRGHIRSRLGAPILAPSCNGQDTEEWDKTWNGPSEISA